MEYRNLVRLLHGLTHSSVCFSVALAVALSATAPSAAAGTAPLNRPASIKHNNAVVYHGRIVRPDGTPINGTLQTVAMIRSPEPASCLLWSETQSVELKNGSFSMEIGHDINRIVGPSGGVVPEFGQVFINNPSLTLANAVCDVGSTYTPGGADDRLLTVRFNDNGNILQVESLPIKSVPFALQASEVAGFGIENLMKISGSGSAVTFSPEETRSLKDLLGGDLDWDLKNRRLTNVADPTLATDAANRQWVLSQIVAGSSIPQNANLVHAGPAAGIAAAPGFRALVPNDLPSIDASKITTGLLPAARGGTGLAPAAGHANRFYGVNAAGSDAEFKTITAGAGVTLTPSVGGLQISATGTGGTVTSVGVVVPSFMNSAGGPITSNGDINLSFNSQAAATFLAAPAGASGAPTFRAMSAVDVPNLDTAKLTTGTLPIARGGSGVSAGVADANKFFGLNAAGTAGETKAITAGSGVTLTPSVGGLQISATGTGGTVTSVGVVVPSFMSSAGGPITSNGDINLSFNSQAAATFLAAPAGASGAPTFRAMSAVDVPNLDTAKLTTGTLPIARGGSGVSAGVADANKFFGLNAAGTAGETKAITAGSGVTLTPSVGGLQISATGTGGTITALSGDVTASGTGSVTATVNSVGAVTAANVASGATAANNAVSTNTASRIVLRDGSGNFAAGQMTGTRIVANSPNTQVAVEVTGQVLSKVYNNAAGTAINWNNGNLQYTSANCGAMTFSNMLDGGSYTLVVKGTTPGSCSFSQTSPDTLAAGAFNFVPAIFPTSGHTVFTFLRAGPDVYVSWITGF